MEYYDGGPLRHFGDVLAMGADRYGEKTAFTSFGGATSYRELDGDASRVANALVDHGVEPDDRVGLFVPNTVQFPEAYFGVLRAGAVPVPLNLRMVDRADDMIIVGGENVYPAEVESALYEHPDVAEAAVVGAPHEVKGEVPVAFVVLEEGAEATEEQLRRFSLDHVATYAHPRRVFFVEELPRSATQKVQRYRLEAEVEDLLDGPLASSDELD
jgi:acyl-CoA synthetase (AMP-forming)/AMP-acid ligase II